MSLDILKIRKLLATFQFKPLFIEELGWNLHNAKLDVIVDGQIYTLTAVAEKCSMVAFLCDPGINGHIPSSEMRRKIERQVAKNIHEHLIIFIDAKQTLQRWQWVRREHGKPAAFREHPYHAGQPGDSLIQKLQFLAISLEEEESITLPDMTTRVKGGFDVERITKRFYDLFKTEHETFLKFLKGIPEEEMERWYVSVMLNRLMFIYFVQKKNFLNNDTNYLRNKLTQCKKELGRDRYYNDFLCPLFFEGFAKRKEDRSAKVEKLLGEIPYLNGGIFMPHQIEQIHGRTITIPDKAFEQLFDFFDAYQWHLDERPLKRDNEINPDVLGYIFEKYINQKQMGAYYTKEDITSYISKNTIIPFLFEKTREKCKVAFEGERSVWRILQDDPETYIYPAIAHGIVWDTRQTPLKRLERPFDLPQDITAGISDISKRTNWNKPASPEYALPTEIWREVVARRKRYKEIRGKIVTGEIRSINDFITYNLNIRQFAQDVIANCEGPELLMAFWKAIESVTVLDPTCGSGAFLFAALNILEPLYEACLDRMQFFLEEWGEGGKKHHPNYYKLFTETLKRIDDHANHKHFVLKSIIVNNLYGVDIMEEAVEICKLRLFLKLVAQINNIEHIEPLPDIDFNIRAGNTLVGFATLDEVRKTQEGKLGFGKDEIARIEEEADITDRAFRKFREMQTTQGMKTIEFADSKEALRSRLKKLTDELDKFLAGEYRVDIKKEGLYEKWLKSHQPFHWFAEFYGILSAGGFDVIIGNPPYVEYNKISSEYTVQNYETIEGGNLYVFVLERSFKITSVHGRIGMIVPISITAAQRMASLQEMIFANSNCVYLSNFALRPAALFPGIMQRLTICLLRKGDLQQAFTSDYITWYADERPTLFERIRYVEITDLRLEYSIPKVNNNLAKNALLRIIKQGRHWHSYKEFKGTNVIYYHNAGGYWIKTFNFKPYYRSLVESDKRHTTTSELYLPSIELSFLYLSILNSNTFYFFWKSLTDARHVYPSDIAMFPIRLPISNELNKKLQNLCKSLMSAYQLNSKRITYGKAEVDQFYVSPCKPIIDEIDQVLAEHYGFADEELDYIINYDIKYRMGQDSGEVE